MQYRIFVYGTLKRGQANHRLLKSAQFEGGWSTAPQFTLYDFGDYPGAIEKGQTTLHGEIYLVNHSTLQRVDQLEEYPDFYTRKLIDSAYGPAWIYLLNHTPASFSSFTGGAWPATC
jgi:gamma-glutamylcyclotransferase (GGCT)/AIG2-like uncharacterized protein YtfP